MSQRKISKLSSTILHSIPILLNRRNKFNNNLRYVSYSIPLVCGLALLLILGVAINPVSYSNKTYAIVINDEGADATNETGDEVDESPETLEGKANASIMPLASAVNPSSSLTVATPSLSTIVAPGEIGYIASNVTYNATDTTAYTLQITYASGKTGLTNGSTTIAGASGKTGATMKGTNSDAWGFSWTDSTNTNYDSLTYYTMPSYGTKGTGLSTGKLDAGISIDITKKIVFAAKFASTNENSGHYKTSVLLSLVATPKALPTGFGGIDEMQKMTTAICNSVSIGTTGTLEDTRDKSVYTVGKLKDGKCWMTQNLRIPGGTVMNSANTDLDPSVYVDTSQTYTLPVSTSSFNGAQLNDSAGNNPHMNHQVRNATDVDYGAYYSWCAATAGTCQVGTYANIQPNTSVAGNPTANPAATTAVAANAQASSSICPKGWRLPTGNTSVDPNTDFWLLVKQYPNSSLTEWSIDNGKNGHWIGGANTLAGGAFFPAAGRVGASGTADLGVYGFYWSSVADSATNAHLLDFTSTVINPFRDYSRYNGYSVRCVAR